MPQDWRNWLTACPIAHRGLHDQRHGVVENSIAAADRAIASGFAIECDVQLSADGEAVVFHDFELERLTGSAGKLIDLPAKTICAAQFRDGRGHPPRLAEFLAHIADRAAVIIEIKSDFSGDTRLGERVAGIAARNDARLAIKSFDPAVMAFLQRNRGQFGLGDTPLGMVAEAEYEHPEWAQLSAELRSSLPNFLHWEATRPDFLSWNIDDFPHPTPHLLHTALALPVMTWTVRTPDQLERAKQWADQIIFEETRGLRID